MGKRLLGLYRYTWCPDCHAVTCHTGLARRLWRCANRDPVWVPRPKLQRLRGY
jgi:hypothetical protein